MSEEYNGWTNRVQLRELGTGVVSNCEGCGGAEVPGARFVYDHGAPDGWLVVERCDACCQFPSDQAAGIAVAEHLGTASRAVRTACGYVHAVVRRERAS